MMLLWKYEIYLELSEVLWESAIMDHLDFSIIVRKSNLMCYKNEALYQSKFATQLYSEVAQKIDDLNLPSFFNQL